MSQTTSATALEAPPTQAVAVAKLPLTWGGVTAAPTTWSSLTIKDADTLGASTATLRLRRLLGSAPSLLSPVASTQAAHGRPCGHCDPIVDTVVRCDVAAADDLGDAAYYDGGGSRFGAGPRRYTPFIARAKRTCLQVQHLAVHSVRYLAYASDFGEAMRPVVSPWFVRLTYGIAGADVIGDIGRSAYQAQHVGHPGDVVTAKALHAAVFQVLASLALPAVMIHTTVHQLKHLLETSSLAKRLPGIVRCGPCGAGMCLIPFLPLLDTPCELFVDALFDGVLPRLRAAHGHEECTWQAQSTCAGALRRVDPAGAQLQASSASTWCVAASPPEPYVPFQGCTVEDFSHTLGTEVRLEGPLAESVGNAWRRAGVEPEIARNGRAAIPDSL
eukprot:CAMPEP_0170280458 /NCGR_PEP_ID=MMETSP0116_2-20130129/40242_1 /TAXON_ID=400756 /ORGANISM="Durinskia baltica, Strain CSIRO CS-38" /LENGTH=386 /DNA_ID=CAMNT_0010531787 /DNA_START=54 /DNA_END=1211 /DNA_ORIENTATION=+